MEFSNWIGFFFFIANFFFIKNISLTSYMGPPSPGSGDCFKDFAYLQQRFNFEQLNFFCQQWRAYNELINADNTTGQNPFTVNQQRYLDSLKLDLNATNNPLPMSIRKEIRAMTEDERLLFQVTVRSLKWEKIDGVSKYDLIVILHHPALAPGAYVGAGFLPWHREYLRTFEMALKQLNNYVSLPYWDTTLDAGLPDPTSSVLWTDLFLGEGNGVVGNGPFADWAFAINNQTSTPLSRNLSSAGRLMNDEDVDWMLKQTHFRQFSACVDLRLEQTSRSVHEWVGGCTQNLYYAPQDPVFFLYHAFLDYVWEEWRHNRTHEERVYGYPPNYEACTKYHYAASNMSPFEPLRNIDGFSDLYTQLYYVYLRRPVCSAGQQQNACSSQYLFCNTLENRCQSKISEGGNCTGLSHGAVNPCYRSRCLNGRCVVTGPADLDDGTELVHRVANRTTTGLLHVMRDNDLSVNSTFMKNLANRVIEHRSKHAASLPILGLEKKITQ